MTYQTMSEEASSSTSSAVATSQRDSIREFSQEGKFVTETFDYDGRRQVSVYVPPVTPTSIVFTGDGQMIVPWSRLLETANISPTMVVGIHRKDDEMLRLHEYSPGFDADRFSAHEKFLVEDVRQWVHSRFHVVLPAERTAVFGVSASAEFALAMRVRHPDIFGVVLCASPGGGYRPPAALTSGSPCRAYLVAGTLESFFLKNTTRWADALRDSGSDVVMTVRVGSHGGEFWKDEFPLMISWAFGH